MKDIEKKAILSLFEEAENGKFFGEVIFKIRDGKIYQIIKGQSLMLDELTEKQS